MQPLVVLIGIVMGSSVALLAGLVMTLAVFFFLPGHDDRLAGEFRPLIQAIAWAVLLAGASAAAFAGHIRQRPWRQPALLAMLVAMVLVGWHYWP